MKKSLYLVVLSLLPACAEMEKAFDAQQALAQMEGPKVPTIAETLTANAKSAEQQGEWATAGQIYQQLLEKDPKNTSYMVSLAESYRRTGQYDKAVAVYDLALKQDGTLLDAREGKGLALLSKGDFEAPIPLFESVMKVDNKRWKTLNALGILFAARSMYPEAGQYFNQALQHSPGNTSVMNNMGLALALNGETDEAIDALLQAGALASGNNMNRRRIDMNLALVYAIAGRLDDAQMVTETYYSGAQLSNNMGLYAHLANDNDMAKVYLNMALTQSKTFYEKAWENLQELSGSNAPPHMDPATTTKVLKVPQPQAQPKKEPIDTIVNSAQ